MASCTNVSSLPWPFNPAGHYMDLQGEKNHSLISNTALVYAHDGLPKPWPYVFIFALLSFGFALFGTISAWKFSEPKKKSMVSRFRKPFVTFGVFRTIMMVVQSARMAHTHRIPSSISTVSIAFSLISNFLDWENTFDHYSWAVLACAIVLLCLVPVQLKPNSNLFREYERLVSGADGYGTMILFGDTCVRTLQKDETCSALNNLACTHGPLTDLTSKKGIIGEYMAVLLGLVCIPVFLYYMVLYVYRHVIPNILPAKSNIVPTKGNIVPSNGDNLPANGDNLPSNGITDDGALRPVMKLIVLAMNLLMFILVGLLAWNLDVKYVGVTEVANGIRISECFACHEPEDRADFLKLWFNQPRSPADFVALIAGT